MKQLPPGGARSDRERDDRIRDLVTGNRALEVLIEALEADLADVKAREVGTTGTVSLSPDSATTVVTNAKAAANSVITLTPLTASAATELATLYVSARAAGSFTLTHTSSSATGRNYAYKIHQVFT